MQSSNLWSVSWCVLILNDVSNSVFFLNEWRGGRGEGVVFVLLSMWLYCECFVYYF
jgi:hypothetical protein